VKLEFPEKGLIDNVLAGKVEVLLFNPENPENPWKTPPPLLSEVLALRLALIIFLLLKSSVLATLK